MTLIRNVNIRPVRFRPPAVCALSTSKYKDEYVYDMVGKIKAGAALTKINSIVNVFGMKTAQLLHETEQTYHTCSITYINCVLFITKMYPLVERLELANQIVC